VHLGVIGHLLSNSDHELSNLVQSLLHNLPDVSASDTQS
jgi:hypothetical protein